MKWYYYLNFVIYRYYNKKEKTPIFATLAVTSLLLNLNIFSIYMVYLFVTDFWTIPKLNSNYKAIIIIFLSFLVITNYFLIFYKKKYIKIFDNFKKNSEIFKHWDISAKLYIIMSIVICIIVLIIADLRNHNFELYFLK